jgi:tetratricopeptide (TPR) repeat protein
VAIALYGMGEVADRRADHRGASDAYRRALAIRQTLHAPHHLQVLRAQRSLATSLTRLRQHDEATALLKAAFETQQGANGLASQQTQQVLQQLITALDTSGKRAEAGRYRAFVR